MAHRTSAASLHAARTVLKNYTLIPKPADQLVSGSIQNIQATETHVGIIIDLLSNVFHISSLRPELWYWQRRLRVGTAPPDQIAGFLKKTLSAYETLPKDTLHEDKVTTLLTLPKEFTGLKSQVHVISKPAKEATRGLKHYFTITPKSGSIDEVLDNHGLAKLIDVCLGLHRTMKLVPMASEQLKRLTEGQATVTEIKKCFREMGVVLEYLPNYENREEEVKLL